MKPHVDFEITMPNGQVVVGKAAVGTKVKIVTNGEPWRVEWERADDDAARDARMKPITLNVDER